jgi:ABC-2 type transport system permease protein
VFGVARNLRIFLSSQRYQWLSFLIYRSQGAIWLVVFSLSTLASVVGISVIYSVSNGIAGWSYYQILALSGLANTILGVVDYLVNPWNLVTNMRNGTFDQVLTKPYNPIVLVLSRQGWVAATGSIVSGLALFVYSIAQLQVNPLAIVPALALVALGCVAVTLFMVFMSMLAYVLFKSANFLHWIVSIAKSTAEYPLGIYGVTGIFLLTVGLPIGIASFYPAELMFSKIDYTPVLVVAAIAIVLSYLFYRGSLWLLKFYTSGGG